jgi:hypothetical protein
MDSADYAALQEELAWLDLAADYLTAEEWERVRRFSLGVQST